MGSDMQEIIEPSNLIDGDLLARFLLAVGLSLPFSWLVSFSQRLGLNQAEVWVIPLGQPKT